MSEEENLDNEDMGQEEENQSQIDDQLS